MKNRYGYNEYITAQEKKSFEFFRKILPNAILEDAFRKKRNKIEKIITIKNAFPFPEKEYHYLSRDIHELNAEYNKRINECIGKNNFYYIEWSIKNKLKLIDTHRYMKLKYKREELNQIDIKKYIKNNDYIDILKQYKGNLEIIEAIRDFDFEKNVYFLKDSIDYSCCLEFPISRKSIILMEKKIVDLDIFLDFIHEFSHAIFNSYKHKKRKITNLETDERMAYLIQEELIKKCFPEIYSSFIEYIYGLLLNNSLTFEFEDYIFSNFRKMDKSLEFKTQIFKRLLKKYVFPSNFSEKWIEDKNLFVLLFIVQFILEL